ncbi:MAG TPA: rRNA maturation RNase YbeY [Elusimicrobiota bacterium]|nr:rRNA maturation RNase YbeY [Elusimicrobiota bacterium]
MGRESLTVRVSGLPLLPRAARKRALIAAAVRRAFALEGSRRRGDIGVIFVSRAEMRSLNRQYLGHDTDTDVITFEHEPFPGVPAAEQPVGDIFISAWMAGKSAQELGHSALRETLTLAAHGALHLLGHDDHSPKAKARMFRRQDEVVEALGA